VVSWEDYMERKRGGDKKVKNPGNRWRGDESKMLTGERERKPPYQARDHGNMKRARRGEPF